MLDAAYKVGFEEGLLKTGANAAQAAQVAQAISRLAGKVVGQVVEHPWRTALIAGIPAGLLGSTLAYRHEELPRGLAGFGLGTAAVRLLEELGISQLARKAGGIENVLKAVAALKR